MAHRPVVYLDVLLAVNLCINYILLLVSGKFLGISYKRWRLVLGASVGALGALVFFLPTLPLPLDLLLKLPLSALMAVVSFPIHSRRDFCKILACLYTVSFVFAGGLLGLSACFAPNGLLLKNSAVYLAVSPVLLLGGFVVCYGCIWLLYRILGQRTPQALFCTLQLQQGEETASLVLKIDTGNHLTEPFSGLPVVIAERRAIAGFLEKTAMPQEKLRWIPYETVSGAGLLPAFRPHTAKILCGNREICTNAFYLAISDTPLDGRQQGLLPPALLEMGNVRAVHTTEL